MPGQSARDTAGTHTSSSTAVAARWVACAGIWCCSSLPPNAEMVLFWDALHLLAAQSRQNHQIGVIHSIRESRRCCCCRTHVDL